MDVARINDETITAEDFVKLLRLDNSFNSLIERIVTEKLTVQVARQSGISVSAQEVQERVDQFRRVQGLHRAQDTLDFLEALGVSVEEFETYMTDSLYREKMLAQVTSRDAVEEYFRLHSPKFDSIEVSHIIVDSEGKARELMAVLEDEPELFAEMAREHSLDNDTKDAGGYMGKYLRGSLSKDAEAKIFNAESGELRGPFASDNGLLFEIFRIDAKHTAQLDEKTARDVSKMVHDEWLRARSQEHRLEVL